MGTGILRSNSIQPWEFIIIAHIEDICTMKDQKIYLGKFFWNFVTSKENPEIEWGHVGHGKSDPNCGAHDKWHIAVEYKSIQHVLVTNAAIQFYLSRVHINKKSTLKDLFPSSPLARAAAPKAPQ